MSANSRLMKVILSIQLISITIPLEMEFQSIWKLKRYFASITIFLSPRVVQLQTAEYPPQSQFIPASIITRGADVGKLNTEITWPRVLPFLTCLCTWSDIATSLHLLRSPKFTYVCVDDDEGDVIIKVESFSFPGSSRTIIFLAGCSQSSLGPTSGEKVLFPASSGRFFWENCISQSSGCWHRIGTRKKMSN